MTAPALKAAAVQFEPVLGDKDRNVAALLRRVEDAALAGASLIVTPEMGTTGYCWFDRAEVAPQVEPIPGPTTDRFAAIAKARDCWIVIGMPEVDPVTDLYYNAAVLIGPEGVVGVHRKSHPYIAEPKWAAAGDTHTVFDTPLGRIGLLICMDIHFVETARLMALDGVDVICHVSAWLAERTPAPYWISRAVENGCWLVEANRWGLERTVQFSGGSCVIAPDGTIAASVDGGDATCFAAVDTARSRARTVFGEPVLAQRRPALYTRLMTDTFLWNPSDFFGLYGHRPLPPGRRGTVSVVQMAPADDVAANLARIVAAARAAKAEDGADLVVFPELALTGLRRPAERAVAIDDPAIDALQRAAIEARVHLVVGFAERAEGRTYDSALVVGPEGVLACHRKLHLTRADRAWASAGDAWTVVDLPIGRLGVLVGHDAAFPEAGRCLALEGCDLIAVPAAHASGFTAAHAGSAVAQSWPIPTGRDPLHWHFYRTRAGENNVFLAFANVVWPAEGTGGRSGVFGPDTFEFPRREAAIVDGEGRASAEIDTRSAEGSRYPTCVVRRKDLVSMRWPQHYRPLLARRDA